MKHDTRGFGIERLRAAVRLFANCNETFNQQFSTEELVNIHEAYNACGWDIFPDCWPDHLVDHARERGGLAGSTIKQHFDKEDTEVSLELKL